jgi:hypothetical protein
MRRILLIVAAAGCGGTQTTTKQQPDDDCFKYASKLSQAKPELESGRDQMADQCRAEEMKWRAEPAFGCILVAPDNAAVIKCLEEQGPIAAADVQRDQIAKDEAQVSMKKLSKALKDYYAKNASYPTATAAATPTGSQCALPDKAFKPDPALWTSGVWKDLGFSMTEPHRFRYAYQGGGDAAVVTATADTDCDGFDEITFTLTGSAENKQPKMSMTKTTAKPAAPDPTTPPTTPTPPAPPTP